MKNSKLRALLFICKTDVCTIKTACINQIIFFLYTTNFVAWLHLKFLIFLAWRLWIIDCYVDILGCCLKPAQKMLMPLRAICLYLTLS